MAYVGVSMPLFWLGLLLILVFSFQLGWFPPAGQDGTSVADPSQPLPRPHLCGRRRATHPRASMVEVLVQDYIRTARSKGLPEYIVIIRHALRNAVVPGPDDPRPPVRCDALGAVVTETVFSRPGLGRLVVSAILWKDYPLVQGIVLFMATTYVVVNLLVDVCAAWLDPRTRHGSGVMATRPRSVGSEAGRLLSSLARLEDRGDHPESRFRLRYPLLGGWSSRCSRRWVAPHDPIGDGRRRRANLRRSSTGSERTVLGRDVLSRVVFGARVSLDARLHQRGDRIGAGTVLGLVSGYYRGPVDTVLMRLVDAMLGLPGHPARSGRDRGSGTQHHQRHDRRWRVDDPPVRASGRSTVSDRAGAAVHRGGAAALGVPDMMILLRDTSCQTRPCRCWFFRHLEFGSAISVGCRAQLPGSWAPSRRRPSGA